MLRVLSENPTVNATFFIWGEQALQHDDVVTEVLRARHSGSAALLASPERTGTWMAAEVREDIDRVTTLLHELGAPAAASLAAALGAAS